MYTRCYKVVTLLDDSIFISHNISQYDINRIKNNDGPTKAVVYQIDRIALPSVKDSKLFCFLNIEDAIAYAGGLWGRDKSVLMCDAENIVEYSLPNVPIFDGRSIEEIWNSIKSGQGFSGRPTPKGTYLADEIIPRKLICTFYA